MDLTWFGTASIVAECRQGKLLFDPFVPLKGSPVNVRIEEFDGYSDIFVTHCHLDHVADLPKIVKRNPDVMLYCTMTPYRTMLKKGILEHNLTLIHYGDILTVNGFSVRVYHGKHAVLPKADRQRIVSWIKSPARWNAPSLYRQYIEYRENDETVAYRIEADGKTVFLMGSMNLRDEVQYPTGADALVLPYNGWDDNLPPAVRTVERLKPKRVLLDHYDDTFPPVSSPVDLSPVLQRYADRMVAMNLREPIQV